MEKINLIFYVTLMFSIMFCYFSFKQDKINIKFIKLISFFKFPAISILFFLFSFSAISKYVQTENTDLLLFSYIMATFELHKLIIWGEEYLKKGIKWFKKS